MLIKETEKGANTKINNIPWVEKYRPTQFDDIVLDPINRRIFQNILQKNDFPNLLFYGPPGTGKTTTIINLIQNYTKRTMAFRTEKISNIVTLQKGLNYLCDSSTISYMTSITFNCS